MKTLRQKLTNELRNLPGMEEKIWPDHPGFTSFNYKGKEVAHFDSNNEIDVRLTKHLIKRERLTHPNSTRHPDGNRKQPNWIVLPFRRENELKEIVRLVKLAMEQI